MASLACPMMGTAMRANRLGPRGQQKQNTVNRTVCKAASTVAVKGEPQTLQEALALSKAFNKGFSTSQFLEHAYWVEPSQIEGKLPEGLKGTLLRNGPGLFEVGGRKVPQPFDGDGMVCSLAFDGNGKAFFRNKFVRTPGFVAERRSGKQLYRSAFNRGLPDPGSPGITEISLPGLPTIRFSNPLDFKIKDTANTNILRWGGKTLALYERGAPWSLGNDLSTQGTDNLGGSMGDQKYMGAHLRFTKDAATASEDRLVTFSFVEVGAADALVTLYEYDTDFKLKSRIQHRMPGAAFGFFHDIAVTPHYYVLLENPIRMDVASLLTKATIGQQAIVECMLFDPTRPARLHLVPRPGSGLSADQHRTLEVPGGSFFTFHHVNAYEVDMARGAEPTPGGPSTHLVLDSFSASSVDLGNNVDNVGEAYYGNTRTRTDYHRIVVDLAKAKTGSASAVSRFCVAPRACEFPVVAPGYGGRPHSKTYMIACPKQGGTFYGPLQGISRLQVDPLNGVGSAFDASKVKQSIWVPEGRKFPSEVAFVPRNAASHSSSSHPEEDGWLMSVLFDADTTTSQVVVLDAADVAAGPVARINLTHHVPQGLHGMWTPDYLGPEPGTPSSKPYDIRDGV